MKSYLLFLFALILSLTVQAQVSQPVQVLEYQGGEKKTALQGVELAVTNAGATMSDAKGKLTLQFRTLKAGDKVNVRRLQKSGYEIFNKAALEQWTVSPSHPFRLVMCKSEQFAKMCQDYWKTSSESYRRQYEQDQQSLENQYKQQKLQEEEYKTQLSALKEQFDNQLNNLETYVEQFARIDLSELSKQEKKIINLVRDGKTDEAIALYESLGYLDKFNQQTADILKIDQAQKELSKLEQKKREERSEVQAALRRQITTYQMAGGRENFRKASELFRQAAMADTTNLPLLYDYAENCYLQFDQKEAIQAIDVYLRNLKDSYHQILGLRLRAQAKMDLREFDQAIVDLNEAMDIAKQMENQGKGEQVEFVTCQLYNNLMDIYSATGNENIESLIASFEPKIDSLYKEHPERYEFEMAQFDYCKALFAITCCGDLQTALKYLEHSAAIVEPYLDKNVKQEVDVIITATYYYLPEIYSKMGEYEKALKYQLKGLARIERLYEQNPASYAVNVAVCNSSIADTYGFLKRFEEAETCLARAFETLLSLESSVAINEYMFPFSIVGYKIYTNKGDAAMRKKYAKQAVDAYANLQDWAQRQYAKKYQDVKEYLDSLVE